MSLLSSIGSALKRAGSAFKRAAPDAEAMRNAREIGAKALGEMFDDESKPKSVDETNRDEFWARRGADVPGELKRKQDQELAGVEARNEAFEKAMAVGEAKGRATMAWRQANAKWESDTKAIHGVNEKNRKAAQSKEDRQRADAKAAAQKQIQQQPINAARAEKLAGQHIQRQAEQQAMREQQQKGIQS